MKEKVMTVFGTRPEALKMAPLVKELEKPLVEAGLRTWNKYFPYPEEMNRQLTGFRG